MIAYIALVLSIINSILWVVFAVGIRKLFKALYPMLQAMGIAGTQNLKYSGSYGIIGEPSNISDAESEQ